MTSSIRVTFYLTCLFLTRPDSCLDQDLSIQPRQSGDKDFQVLDNHEAAQTSGSYLTDKDQHSRFLILIQQIPLARVLLIFLPRR